MVNISMIFVLFQLKEKIQAGVLVGLIGKSNMQRLVDISHARIRIFPTFIEM